MASVQHSLKNPPMLEEAVQIRWRELGYQSFSAYLIGLQRYDLMVQGDHSVTLPIARSRPEERDKVDAQLLELTKSGKGVRGAFLTRMLQRLAGRAFKSPEHAALGLAEELAKANAAKGE